MLQEIIVTKSITMLNFTNCTTQHSQTLQDFLMEWDSSISKQDDVSQTKRMVLLGEFITIKESNFGFCRIAVDHCIPR